MHDDAVPALEKFLASPLYSSLRDAGKLLPVERALDHPTEGVYSQPLVRFLSYPYEWSAGMLHSAAMLTLEIARKSLELGWGLKDATPFNIAFEGTKPVFLDVLSFEERNPRDPVWLPYGQFVRTFLLPLMDRTGTRAPLSLRGQEGIEPEEMIQSMSFAAKLRPAALGLVTLPALLGSRGSARAPAEVDPEKASYVLGRLFTRLEKTTRKLTPANRQSRWTGYAKGVHDAAYHQQRASIVQRAIVAARPRTVLDIGCNTGAHSLVAAEAGSSVVAIDSDATVVGHLVSKASEKCLDILPIVVDIADPTPARGWRNLERSSFLERATGRFDFVLAMAVMHHVMLTGGIPLDRFIELVADLTRDRAMVEFIPWNDAMFQSLLRGRDALYRDHTRERFLSIAERWFVIESSDLVGGGGREIFMLRKRSA